jgi:ubiquinone biosynthesis protein COQ9
MSEDLRAKLVAAALPHVAFDGWSQSTFDAAVADAGVDPVVARAIFPRGAVELAVGFHVQGDAAMCATLESADLSEMRFRDKVAFAVRQRLELCPDKEAVRRGTTLFALPQYAPTGTKLIWGTCDAIWSALGDSSQDINWYTKRTTLSGVYAATVLFWLGDDSEGHADTWAFLDRRIDNVMQFEKTKAAFQKSPFGKALARPLGLLGRITAPRTQQSFPGRWSQN